MCENFRAGLRIFGSANGFLAPVFAWVDRAAPCSMLNNCAFGAQISIVRGAADPPAQGDAISG
jgi:hypothetical protein